MWNVRAYWQHTLHYNSPACFSCSIVSFEGSGIFSCVSVFFNLIYRISQSQQYQVCQTWLQKVWSKLPAIKVWSALWPPPSADVYDFNCFFFFFFFFLAILKKVLISLRKYKFPKLMIFIFIWSKNYEISICISFVSPGNSHRKTNFLFPW